MNFQFVNTISELDQMIAQLEPSDVLYVDTEFVRERTLFPHFGLLQISDGVHVYLVDPQSIEDFSSVWKLLVENDRLIVLHAFGEDLELLWNEGCPQLTHVLDTQIAAGLVGWGTGAGFAALVEKVSDVALDKSHSRTNWLKRPLSPEQLRYAADDVIYLAPLAQRLITELEEAGLTDICMDECKRLANRSTKDISKRYLDVKNSWPLNPQQLAVLQVLATWRYNQAFERDMALSFVVKDLALVEIARHQPTSMAELKRVPELSPMELRIHGKRLLKLVEEGRAVKKEHWPEPIRRVIDIPSYKVMQKSLSKLVKKVAEKAGIPDTMLASKRQQGEYLMWRWRHQQGLAVDYEPVMMSGWRKQMLEPSLIEWQHATP